MIYAENSGSRVFNATCFFRRRAVRRRRTVIIIKVVALFSFFPRVRSHRNSSIGRMARTKQTRRIDGRQSVPYQARKSVATVEPVPPPAPAPAPVPAPDAETTSNSDGRGKRKKMRDEAVLSVGRERGILMIQQEDDNNTTTTTTTTSQVASKRRKGVPPSFPPFDDWKTESVESFNDRAAYLIEEVEGYPEDVEERIRSVVRREYLESVTAKESRRLVDMNELMKSLRRWNLMDGDMMDILEKCFDVIHEWEKLRGLELTATGRPEEADSYYHERVTAFARLCGEIRTVISSVNENLPPRSRSKKKKKKKKGGDAIQNEYRKWAEKNWDAYEAGNKIIKKCVVSLLIQEILSYRGFHQKFFSVPPAAHNNNTTNTTTTTSFNNCYGKKNSPSESSPRYDFLKVGIPRIVAEDMGVSTSKEEESPYPFAHLSKDCQNLLEEYGTPLNYEDTQIWLNVAEDWIANSIPESNKRDAVFQMNFKRSVLPSEEQNSFRKGFLECFEEATDEKDSWKRDTRPLPTGAVLFEMGPRKRIEEELFGIRDGALTPGFSEASSSSSSSTVIRTEPSYVSWHPDALLFRKYEREEEAEEEELVLLVHKISGNGVKAVLGQSLASNRLIYNECQIVIQPRVSMKIVEIENELRCVRGNPSGGIRTHETLPKNTEESRKYRIIRTEIGLPCCHHP